MTNRVATLGLLALGGLAVVCLTILIALGHPAPDVLPELATISVSALAGSLIPGGAAAAASSPTSTPPSSPSSPALAAVEGVPIAAGRVA